MSTVPAREKVLYLPIVRGFYDRELTRSAVAAVRSATSELSLAGVFPGPAAGGDGLIQSDADFEAYWAEWRGQLYDIKALVVLSGDFMQERRAMDAVRLLPEDVPVFLLVHNDDPSDMAPGRAGDSLCGSFSVHHNVRMLGRRMVRSARLDLSQPDIVRRTLAAWQRIMDGVEAWRGMRVAMLGVNPSEFATTFTNQAELFRLGVSLHPYELLDFWGDTVLSANPQAALALGGIKLRQPIAVDDPRIATVREQAAGILDTTAMPPATFETMARCFLWIKDVFERDRIDAGAIHCWPEFGRYFGMAPCAFAMLANALLRKPVVCEVDLCHAVMARLAWVMTGNAGVILDFNNNGWEPRVLNVFHCSQTPPNWLRDKGVACRTGQVEGTIRPGAFTGVSAATSADACHATVFRGAFLREAPPVRGSSGWAFVPNLPAVLEAVQNTTIHHFVAFEGDVAAELVDVLRFRGVQVADLSCELRSLDEIEAELGGQGKTDRRRPAVYPV